MKILTWSIAAVLLAGLTAGGDEPAKGVVEQIREQEVARIRATEAYYRKAGKVESAEYYRIKADQAEKKTTRPPTIYVPVIRSEVIPRADALQLTELLIKTLERDLGYKVVGTPGEADLVFDGAIKPAPRARP